MSRRAIAIVLVGVGMLLSGPIPSAIEASGQPAILTDSIAPGIVTGSLGLGTGSVAVAADGYVTLFVRSSPALANRTVQAVHVPPVESHRLRHTWIVERAA